MLDKFNGKLSIGARLGILSGLFVASSAAVTGFLVRNSLNDIAFSKKAGAGTEYLGDVWDALQSDGRVDASRAESEFNAGAAANAFLNAQNERQRLDAGLALIARVADQSNLTLDPDLDSFYAMDAATVKLPALLTAALELENAVAAPEGPEHQLQVSIASDRVQAAADAAVSSLSASIEANVDGKTAAALQSTIGEIQRAASELITAAKTAAPGSRIDGSLASYVDATDSTWRKTADELSRLLDVRIAGKQSELIFQLLLIALFLAVAGGVAVLTSTGMSRRFKSLSGVMDRLREGDFKVDVPHTDDGHETGKIAKTLKVLRDDMAERTEADARRLAEMQLGAEGMLKAVSMSQAMIQFEPDGTIIEANENFLNATGYSLSEIQGKHHAMFVGEADRNSAAYRGFWDHLKKGEPEIGRFKRFAKGGREIWLQAAYCPIKDADGRVAKVVKFATDITENVANERDATFKGAAFSGSSIPMMLVNRDFEITAVNEATMQMMREKVDTFKATWPAFNPDKIIGTCIDIFHKNPSHQRQLLSDPSRLPYQANITVGEVKFALNVSAVHDSEGKYVGNVLQWRDTTAEMSNAGVLDALDRSQALIEFKLDGTILDANPNFCQTLGYSLDEIVGKHHSLFVDPAEKNSTEYRQFWEELRKGKFQSSKFRRMAKGGREIWIQATYNPILDGNGVPFKVIKFASDITQIENERKEAEEERLARAQELSEVVASLAGGLKQLAHGDLTSELSTSFAADYEQLRLDFNDAVGKLRDVMGSIVTTAGGIKGGASEISQAADDLSRRTEQQAASLEETAAALDEITATVTKTASGAKQAASVVIATKSDAESSGEVVREAVNAMSSIESSSKEISQIIGVIDEIAFQTNLLALNAGVEAARAGEAGRGFAVVASEVRALAQRSSEAAKEIKGLISASTQHVEAGVDRVGKAGQALAQIVIKVTEVNDLVGEIAASAQEQSTALAQVNTAINQMDQSTQQNAAMVEESTAASHSLTQDASGLMDLMSNFNVGHSGSGSSSSRPAPSGQTVREQQKRAAKFASTGSAALKVDNSDWEEF